METGTNTLTGDNSSVDGDFERAVFDFVETFAAHDIAAAWGLNGDQA